MVRDGFCLLRGAVPRGLLDVAVRAINAELAKGVDPSEVTGFKNGVALPALMVRPPVTDLYARSALPSLLRDLIGDHHAPGAGQIALRFPGAMCVDDVSFTPAPWAQSAWHIDGMTDPQQRWAKRGTLGNFTCLVGVALRDVPAPMSGNLMCYPGSHRVLEAWFNQDPGALEAVADQGEAALPRFLPFEQPVQVCMKAGDVVVAHYQLAHSVAPNTSPDIRYVVYFRVHAKAHKPGEYRPEAIRSIWLDWAGLTHTVEAIEPTLPAVTLQTSTLRARGTDEPSTMNAASATSVTRPVVVLSPKELENLLAKGNTLFDDKNWAEASPCFRQLSDVKPNDFTVLQHKQKTKLLNRIFNSFRSRRLFPPASPTST